MSVNVQNDPSRVVGVADELESIFHVLIFYAIRFLPHNLMDADVPYFLHDYFDRYSTNSRGTRSGLVKRNVMEYGVIKLTSYNEYEHMASEDNTLKFVWPCDTTAGARDPPDFDHPLNDFIMEVLSWFKAHYALRYEESSMELVSEVDPQDYVDGEVPGFEDSDSEVPPRCSKAINGSQEHFAPGLRSTAVSSRTPVESPEVDESTLVLARKLHTHDNLLDLLEEMFEKEWPMEDKVSDKRLRKDGYTANREPIIFGPWEPPENLVSDSTFYAGSDDGEENLEDEEEQSDPDEEDELAVEEMLLDAEAPSWESLCKSAIQEYDDFPYAHSAPPSPSHPAIPRSPSTSNQKRPLEEPATPTGKRSKY